MAAQRTECGGNERGKKSMLNYSISVLSTKPGTKKADITETKAYATAQISSVMSMTEFAEHIADHSSKYNRGDIYAILAQAVDCMRELILDGKKVTLGDLGAFYPRVKSTGAKTAEELTAQNITAVNVRWAPGVRFKNLRAEATFQCVPSRQAVTDALAAERGKSTTQPAEGDGDNSMD